MSWRRAALMAFLLAVSWVLAPCAAEACAVCYGAADSPLTAGVNNGILVLLAVIAVVQVGFVALFLSIRQRAMRERQRQKRFQLIRGGAG